VTRTQRLLARLEYGFIGEIYEFVIRRPVLRASAFFLHFDTRIVDSAALGVGRLTQAFGQILKTTVSGNVQHYGLIMAAAVLLLLVLAMMVR
jgi:NADH:ubiquinone oxidoreductase subunit 5 (subunit L)/multisubunit Na+/H+ antiporter MnhA subunit